MKTIPFLIFGLLFTVSGLLLIVIKENRNWGLPILILGVILVIINFVLILKKLDK
jgi:uncharacterized protein with PQ loop repeat